MLRALAGEDGAEAIADAGHHGHGRRPTRFIHRPPTKDAIPRVRIATSK